MRRCSITALASGLVKGRSGSVMVLVSLRAFLAGVVGGDQRQLDLGARPDVLGQVAGGLGGAFGIAAAGQRQRHFRRRVERTGVRAAERLELRTRPWRVRAP